MKQTITLAILMLLTFTSVFAKDRTSKHTTVKNDWMSVTYGQPMKKGRVIFSETGLVPFGQIWRTGADEATEVTLTKDCMFAGHQLKAGTYTLITKPGKAEWTVILNSKLGQWGAYDYEKNIATNVIEGTAAVKQLDKVVETFTITLEKDAIVLSWDQTSVIIPVKSFN